MSGFLTLVIAYVLQVARQPSARRRGDPGAAGVPAMPLSGRKLASVAKHGGRICKGGADRKSPRHLTEHGTIFDAVAASACMPPLELR
jgi:hypothetical protein